VEKDGSGGGFGTAAQATTAPLNETGAADQVAGGAGAPPTI